MPKAPSAEQARILAKGPFPDYPFTPHAFVHASGLTQSYLDEGPRDGEVIVMLHGNPSWSYYWRHLVLGLRDRYRCIVPDHIGMGLSDKPGDKFYSYTLQSRIDDLDALLTKLDVGDNLTLAVHDWGGMIGFGWALRNAAQGRASVAGGRMPEATAARVKRLVILNTGAFPLPNAKPMPWQLRLGRDSLLGAGLIRGFNAFAAGAAKDGVETSLRADVRRAYLAPYDSWANRIATLRFVQDIPLVPGDRAWPPVEEAGKRLHEFADRPSSIGWGLRDFVFDKHFLDAFTSALPNADVHAFEDAGHYVLEDKHAVLVPAIRSFLDAHPLR
ncbi:MAG TPA: alpha/beta fold hydrolase [Xanthomonadaceae bacterium]|nr:alpha/beta fold hydrolase [Xanthomonadaceae bacterium]